MQRILMGRLDGQAVQLKLEEQEPANTKKEFRFGAPLGTGGITPIVTLEHNNMIGLQQEDVARFIDSYKHVVKGDTHV